MCCLLSNFNFVYFIFIFFLLFVQDESAGRLFEHPFQRSVQTLEMSRQSPVVYSIAPRGCILGRQGGLFEQTSQETFSTLKAQFF